MHINVIVSFDPGLDLINNNKYEGVGAMLPIFFHSLNSITHTPQFYQSDPHHAGVCTHFLEIQY